MRESLNEQTRKPLASPNPLPDVSGTRRTKLSLLRLVRPASPSGFSRTLSPTKYLHSNSNTPRLASRLPASGSFPSNSSSIKQHTSHDEYNNTRRRSVSEPPHGDTLKGPHPSTPNHMFPLGTRKTTQKISPSSIFSVQDDPFRYSRGLAAYQLLRATPKKSKNSAGGNSIGEHGALEIELQSESSPNLFSEAVDVLPRNLSEPESSIPAGTSDVDTLAQGEDVVVHGPQSRLAGPGLLSQLQTPTPLLRARMPHDSNLPLTSDLGPLPETSPQSEATTKSNSLQGLTSSQRNRPNLEPCDLGIFNNIPVTHAVATLSRSHSDVFLSATTTMNKSSAILKPDIPHRRSYSTQGQIEHISSGAHRRALQNRYHFKLQDSEFQGTLDRSDLGEGSRVSQRKGVLHATIQTHSLHSGTEDGLNAHVPGEEPSNAAAESATPFTTGSGAMEKLASCDISFAPTRNRIRRRGLIFDNFPLPLESLLESETEFETRNQVDPEDDGDCCTGDVAAAAAVQGSVEEDDYSSVSETLESYFDTCDASASTTQPEVEYPEQQTIAHQTDHAVSQPLPSISIDLENQPCTIPCALDSSTATTSCSEIPPCTSLELSSRAATSLASATQPPSETSASNPHFPLPNPMSRSPRRHHALLRMPSPLRSEITPSPPSQTTKLGLRLPPGGSSSNVINSDNSKSFASIPATARTAATRAVTWAAQRGMRIKQMVSSSSQSQSHAPGHESQIGRSGSSSNRGERSIRNGGLKIFTRAVPMKLPARAFARGRSRSLSHNQKPTATPNLPAGALDTTVENAVPAYSDYQQKHARSTSLGSGATLGASID